MKRDIKKKDREKSPVRTGPERVIESDKARSVFFRSVIDFIDRDPFSESYGQTVGSLLATLSNQLGTLYAAFYRGITAEGLFRYEDSIDHGQDLLPPLFEIDSAFARWVCRERRPVLIDAFYSGAGSIDEREMEFLSRIDENGFSYACLVGDEKRPYGMIFFGGGPQGKSFSDPESEFVEMLSRAAAVKIRNTSLINEAAEFKKRTDRFARFRQEVFRQSQDRLKMPVSVMKSTIYSVETDDISSGILVDMARSAVENMESRLEQFFSLCEIDSEGAHLDIKKTDISSLVEDLLREYIPELEEKSITVRFDDKAAGRELYVDPVSLGVVIRNIIDNAVRHIDRGGEIEVGLYLTDTLPREEGIELRMWDTLPQEEGSSDLGTASKNFPFNRNSYENNLVLKIRDNGPGIAGDRIALLSSIPEKIDSDKTGEARSVPTGLAVAQNIIEGHGGRFFCSSTVGQGSEFSIWLPAGF
ncbi:MAG: GAF domain-containing sensor histidine kinase [Candidatus Krumholzibacteriota bacterium]|nr:GAF domain-containing sensor histidine kinase [Candidatus Krumholzibacteriota bacterium]